MKNLAGVKECDIDITYELTQSGISMKEVPIDTQHSEVPYSIIGVLGDFKFKRAWTYWIVSGKVPLHVAKELYSDPVGERYVRVAGHCGCPPPENWCIWITEDNKIIQPEKCEKEYDNMIRNKWIKEDVKDDIIFCDTPEKIPTAVAYVDCYHIDTLEGLILFANTIKNHGLDK